jgi:hypothetical protein
MIAFFFGCEKDETIVVLKSDPSPAVITSTPTDLAPEIKTETLNDELKIAWNKADYGVDTEVKYTLQLDYECGAFENPINLGTSNINSFDITLENLNAKLVNDLKLAPHLAADLKLRIISTVNNNLTETSEVVTFSIIPWSEWPEALWLVGEDYEPAIYKTDNAAFEGYAYLNEGDVFKLADTRSCDRTTYGDAGGALSTAADANAMEISSDGYYKINADTENETYQFTLIETWGMIGTATAGGWNSSTPMTYDATNKIWKATVNLTSGALKFRANNDWGINYGPADINALAGTLIQTNDAINIADAGNYTVVIDLSKEKSTEYTYSITKNAVSTEPTELWLPGDYQGWDPGAAPTIKSVSDNAYEGYVYFSGAAEFKFTSAANWDNTNYGNGGDGVLTTDGLAGNLSVASAGYYLIKVNTADLTYQITLISTMGMIGTATPGGWDSSTALTFDAQTGLYSKTIALIPGALKFRANDAWTINYGPADSNALNGYLIFDDPGAINISEAGNYTVTVDFSRAETPYKYAYTVVKN